MALHAQTNMSDYLPLGLAAALHNAVAYRKRDDKIHYLFRPNATRSRFGNRVPHNSSMRARAPRLRSSVQLRPGRLDG